MLLKFDCNRISFEWNLKGHSFGISDFSMTQPSCSLSAIKMRISWEGKKAPSVFPTGNTNEKDGLSKDSGGSFSSSFFVVKFLIHRLKERSVHNVPPPRWGERWRNGRGEKIEQSCAFKHRKIIFYKSFSFYDFSFLFFSFLFFSFFYRDW